jgi:ubiquinone/menaquinone biosynthesis C-methylase UbiE
MMKRITENSKHDYFFDKEASEAYLRNVKNKSMGRYIHFLKTLNKLNIRGRYMDVGCGPGMLTQKVALQHPNSEIIAVDISGQMIELAKSELPENLRPRISFIKGDACDLATLNKLGKFELIFSTFTLHHWENAESALENLYSMLNEGGILYIEDLKRVFWLYYMKSKSGFYSSVRASYKPAELKTLLDKIGIKNYKIQTVFPFFMLSVTIRK